MTSYNTVTNVILNTLWLVSCCNSIVTNVILQYTVTNVILHSIVNNVKSDHTLQANAIGRQSSSAIENKYIWAGTWTIIIGHYLMNGYSRSLVDHC